MIYHLKSFNFDGLWFSLLDIRFLDGAGFLTGGTAVIDPIDYFLDWILVPDVTLLVLACLLLLVMFLDCYFADLERDLDFGLLTGTTISTTLYYACIGDDPLFLLEFLVLTTFSHSISPVTCIFLLYMYSWRCRSNTYLSKSLIRGRHLHFNTDRFSYMT